MIELLADLGAAATVLLGSYVAALAVRGYRQHDSAPMGLLAVGVVCIAVVPYLLTYGAPAALSDAATILGVTLSHTVGLLAIYRSFDR
ncbi:MAG: hypothetical protein ABEJ67_00545 [Halanaeroarchaeum sp.]